MWRHKCLVDVKLVDISISDESFNILGIGIGCSRSIKRLKLNRIRFSHEGMQFLVDGVSTCKSLETIDLSCNDLKDEYGPQVA